MAAPTSTTTVIEGNLKKVYASGSENIQNLETEFRNYIPKSSRQPRGRGYFFSRVLQGNQLGQGNQLETEALRDSDSQIPREGSVKVKIFTHTIRVSGLSVEVAKTDADSFADQITLQFENGIKDSAKELNAQAFRDGSGRIAQADGAVVAGTTITFDNGVPDHFRIGMAIAVYTGAGVLEAGDGGAPTRVTVVDITSGDGDNGTIEVSPAVTITDDSFIYRESTFILTTDPDEFKEYLGLPLATDTGVIATVYESIDRSANPQWRGITLDAGTAAVSNDSLQRQRARMKHEGGKTPKWICSSTSQFRKYLDIVVPDVRHTTKGPLDKQYQTLPTWNGMEWLEDTDCGRTDIYMLDTDAFKKYQIRSLGADTEMGDSVIKWNPDFDGGTAYIKEYGNYGTENPKCMVRSTNHSVPTF